MKIGHGLVQLHPSPIEQHHIIGDLFQFSQQVAGYQHAPTIGSKPPDQATDPPDPRRIEALVGSSDQDSRFAKHRQSQPKALFHPEGISFRPDFCGSLETNFLQ